MSCILIMLGVKGSQLDQSWLGILYTNYAGSEGVTTGPVLVRYSVY